jgi:hypothetical protein
VLRPRGRDYDNIATNATPERGRGVLRVVVFACARRVRERGTEFLVRDRLRVRLTRVRVGPGDEQRAAVQAQRVREVVDMRVERQLVGADTSDSAQP